MPTYWTRLAMRLAKKKKLIHQDNAYLGASTDLTFWEGLENLRNVGQSVRSLKYTTLWNEMFFAQKFVFL